MNADAPTDMQRQEVLDFALERLVELHKQRNATEQLQQMQQMLQRAPDFDSQLQMQQHSQFSQLSPELSQERKFDSYQQSS